MLPLELWMMIAELGGPLVCYKLSCCCRDLYDLVRPLRYNRATLHPLITQEPILSPSALELFWRLFPYEKLTAAQTRCPFGKLGLPVYRQVTEPLFVDPTLHATRLLVSNYRAGYKSQHIHLYDGLRRIHQHMLVTPLGCSEYFDVYTEYPRQRLRYHLIYHLDRGNRAYMESLAKRRFILSCINPFIDELTMDERWDLCLPEEKDICYVEALQIHLVKTLVMLGPNVIYVLRPDHNMIHLVFEIHELNVNLIAINLKTDLITE